MSISSPDLCLALFIRMPSTSQPCSVSSFLNNSTFLITCNSCSDRTYKCQSSGYSSKKILCASFSASKLASLGSRNASGRCNNLALIAIASSFVSTGTSMCVGQGSTSFFSPVTPSYIHHLLLSYLSPIKYLLNLKPEGPTTTGMPDLTSPDATAYISSVPAPHIITTTGSLA